MFHRRVARVIAQEGLSGLWPHVRARISGPQVSSAEANRQAIEAYRRDISLFKEKTGDSDVPALGRFYWYHAVDVGDGLVTPGTFDYRSDISHFHFPDDMSGMQVLDVGSATGFFAFEFERRGATVTSIELSSIADWDMPSAEDRALTMSEMMRFHGAASLEELTLLHLHGPFRFCHERLHSKITRHYSRIYVLGDQLKGKQFDLVFLGDILLHLFSPLRALSVVAPLCSGTLIILQEIPDLDDSRPLMWYIGGSSRQGDARSWWFPNKTCLAEMLMRVGFQAVTFPARFEITHRPSGLGSPRTVVHALR
jgi:tRNA (mo5U34)-methyltransferase